MAAMIRLDPKKLRSYGTPARRTSMSEPERKIPLTQGQFTLVDESDYLTLMQWKWRAGFDPKTGCFYAMRVDRSTGRQLTVYMTRFLLGLGPGNPLQGDHKNHDTLDNRRCNIRPATRAQQMQNRGKRKAEGFKGVYRAREGSTFYAEIVVNRKRIYLGTRPTAEAAYNDLYVPAALKHHKEFAYV
jgi:hypothetical protein